MASDPLEVYASTYNRAIAMGLSTGAAQLAAQTAMQGTNDKQNSRSSTVAAPLTIVESGRIPDPGPIALPPKPAKR